MQLPESFAIYGEIALLLCVLAMTLVVVFTRLGRMSAHFEAARMMPLDDDASASTSTTQQEIGGQQ